MNQCWVAQDAKSLRSCVGARSRNGSLTMGSNRSAQERRQPIRKSYQAGAWQQSREAP
jgi:hypothetical protein